MRAIHTFWSFLTPLAAGLVWEDGTGKLPAMGWNSWNTYECNISASLFLTQAQALLDLGLLVRLLLHAHDSNLGTNLKLRTPATNM